MQRSLATYTGQAPNSNMWGNKKAINYTVLVWGEFTVILMFSTIFISYHNTSERYGSGRGSQPMVSPISEFQME